MRKNDIGAAWGIGLYVIVMLLVAGQANVATATPAIMAGTKYTSCTQCHGSPTPAPTPEPAPAPTGCTATIAGNLLLHIPYLSYVDPMSGTLSLWADFVYEFNPTYPALILFKYINAGIINNSSNSCSKSTLSNDFKIHIPDVLLPDGSTHLWLNIEYDPALSTVGNIYFLVTNYGVF